MPPTQVCAPERVRKRGRSHDGKTYSLSGTISGGAYAGGSISALVGFPPNPCLSGSFTGGLALLPPGPPT